jgi:hypothetical protein
MTVLFFILYCACIWSILGTVPCCAVLVVFKHLCTVKAGLRARGILASEREHDKHVHEPSGREGSCRKGDVKDIVREWKMQ